MLLSNGFVSNRHKTENLASLITGKFNQLQKATGDKKRCYYDFGMRKLKEICSFAGYLRSENPNKNDLEIVILALKKTFSKS